MLIFNIKTVKEKKKFYLKEEKTMHIYYYAISTIRHHTDYKKRVRKSE